MLSTCRFCWAVFSPAPPTTPSSRLLPVSARPQLMPPQLAARTARPQSCCQTPCCPTISGIGLTNQKMPVFYKFWPLKLSINLCPFGKPVVQLYLYCFYSFMFTLVTHRFMHNCFCTVLLFTWLFCFLYGDSATLAAKLIIKLDCNNRYSTLLPYLKLLA